MTARRLMLIVFGLVLTVAPSSLLAADAHAGEGGTISIWHGNFGQAFWTLLIFLLVLGVLGRFAWGPLLAGLQKREAFIRDSLESAKRDREQAEARLKEHEQRLLAAREEAGGIVEEARRNAEAVKRRIEEETRRSADETLERARRDIGIARDTALKDLYEQAATLSLGMAGNVLKRQLSPEDHHKLVEEALSELRSQTN